MGIYRMEGEAVSFHREQVQVPSSDVIPGSTQTQPQSTAGNIPHQVATAQARIPILASQAVYHSTLSTSPSIAFRQQGGTPGYTQPAVAQGHNDFQARQQTHLHEVTSSSSQSNSNLSFSTSSGVPNALSSPLNSLYPVGMYTPCGSSEVRKKYPLSLSHSLKLY